MRINRTRTDAAWRAGAPLVLADWLCLAAAPTFAVLALLSAAPDSSHPAHGASPLDGMALMYVLMSAFHMPPWLKLLSRRSRSGRHAKRNGLNDTLGGISMRRFQATRKRPGVRPHRQSPPRHARWTAVAAVNGIQSTDTSDRLIRRLR